MAQSINTTAVTLTASQAPAVLSSGRGVQRPRAADSSSQAMASRSSTPRSVPPAFARSDSTNSPRTRCAQEVVMPHVGHRQPNRATNVHGGNPNCWCVPWPRVSGVRIIATSRGNANPSPIAASLNRSCRLSRVCPLVSITLVCKRWGEDSRNRNPLQDRFIYQSSRDGLAGSARDGGVQKRSRRAEGGRGWVVEPGLVDTYNPTPPSASTASPYQQGNNERHCPFSLHPVRAGPQPREPPLRPVFVNCDCGKKPRTNSAQISHFAENGSRGEFTYNHR